MFYHLLLLLVVMSSCLMILPEQVHILLPTKEKNIYMEEITMSKEKGKVIRLILSHTLFFFQFNSVTEEGRLTKKSRWQTE